MTRHTVLVTAASKHGSTVEIARVVGATIAAEGHVVETVEPPLVDAIDGYDAVVIGSAVYAGHWMKPARAFVERFSDDLRTRKVWMFSSGPVGDPPAPDADSLDLADLVTLAGARDHRLFGGCIDKANLGFGERAVVRAVGAAEGDYRDWHQIALWAKQIAADLSPV